MRDSQYYFLLGNLFIIAYAISQIGYLLFFSIFWFVISIILLFVELHVQKTRRKVMNKAMDNLEKGIKSVFSNPKDEVVDF